MYRLPILITSANHNATWGSPIVYPLWFPGELLAELPRLKRDALVISGTSPFFFLWAANVSEAIL